ncbi:histidine phosphatase family protein [Parahaliea maris]|uniref:Histidine phosphatase family protein n=1 Tax=Parahaliea maris TaxID=2716870 RepID=A0A5C9A4R0_9GAMM|nr:histidine phosphatase family protein [Parahaliea maris]TXS95778.1 histidine phosphatase family protein [Parahaliea maris]
MPRLYAALVRHGDYHQLADTPSAHQPFALTDAGYREAEVEASRFARQLQGENWVLADELHTSTLLRAWQTARIYAQALALGEGPGLTTVEFGALAERCVGAAANLSLGQIAEVIASDPRYEALPPDWKSDSDFCLPFLGAESLWQAGERVAAHIRAAMQGLAASATRDSLQLFVGHGAAFRHAAALLGALPRDQVAAVSMYHARPVILEWRAQGPWRHVAGDWKPRGRRLD